MRGFLVGYPGLADGRFITAEGNPVGLTVIRGLALSLEVDLPSGTALNDRTARSRYEQWTAASSFQGKFDFGTVKLAEQEAGPARPDATAADLDQRAPRHQRRRTAARRAGPRRAGWT